MWLKSTTNQEGMNIGTMAFNKSKKSITEVRISYKNMRFTKNPIQKRLPIQKVFFVFKILKQLYVVCKFKTKIYCWLSLAKSRIKCFHIKLFDACKKKNLIVKIQETYKWN